MKAAVINRYGKASTLKVQEINRPEISDNEILVRVKASSINPIDWKIRKGELQLASGWKFPKILGADFSGIVEAVGSSIEHYPVGSEVFGMVNALKGGAYAEYLKVKPHNLTLKPPKLSHAQAAALPLAGLTALQGLKKVGISSGQQVLINGASGGVGHYAVQIAKAYGAHVTGVSGPQHAAMVKELGADRHINYRTDKVLDGQSRYQIIYDAHGSLSVTKAASALEPGGYYLSTLPSFGVFVHKLKSLVGGSKQFHIIWVKVNSTDLDELKRLAEQAKLRPVIEQSFSLQAVDEAQLLSEGGHVGGKVVLTI